MAYTLTLTEGSLDDIDLMYSATTGYSLLVGGIKVGRPGTRETWGGRLEDQLVRRDDTKRVIPLELTVKGSTGEDLIDRVNALEERLRHAARYHTDGWGDEVFLEFKINDAVETVRFPVFSGEIDTDKLMACGREEDDLLDSVPVILTCGAYWEATETYTLENYIDNPGWWRGAAPGDSWTEVNGGDVTSTIDTTIYEVMGQSLKQVYIVDAVNDTGVISDAQVVVASTAYYFQARGYRVTGCDTLTAQVYDISNGAIIAASVLTFNGDVDEWVTQGVAFTTPVGCISIRVELLCLAGDSVAGGTAYWDAIYLEPRADAPTGWCSGRNLTNELDAADQINALCVTEIPGEVEAESNLIMTMGDTEGLIYIGRRTRDNPHNFIWELLGANAVVTAGDAACKDSALAGDASAPGGQHVIVSFAATQTMALRTYWDISSNLASYYGRFAMMLLAVAGGGTDTIGVKMQVTENGIDSWLQAYVITQSATTAPVNEWNLMAGWTVVEFPTGTHPNDDWDTGNFWRIAVYAETDGGGTPTDSLYIAGCYLMPLDESFLIAGDDVGLSFQANMVVDIQDLDGDRGVFPYSLATNRYYSNVGAVGEYPRLTPEVENWLYFVLANVSTQPDVDITDTGTISTIYRPRGIFLRGSNP